MRVVIIGSGNVATVMGRLLRQQNHEIVQVVSRNGSHAKILAEQLGCGYTDSNNRVEQEADLYLLAVSDNALYEINKTFHIGNKLVVHTAGSVPKDILREVSVNYGVLYPLQSLTREMELSPEIPFLVDGNTEEVISLLSDVGDSISSKVSVANDEQRLKLHVAAVVVSNFTNHLYGLAEDFCNKEGVDFNLLKPLILNTALRIENNSPAILQTGPAVRNDVYTLDKHLQVLSSHPKLKYVYLKLTESIMQA